MVTLAPGICGVAATHVVVQRLERQPHDHHAAVAMHDGLGQPGGAARIDDPQRMVKRQPYRLERTGGGVVARGGIGKVGAVGAAAPCAVYAQVVQQQQVLHRRQGGTQLGHRGTAVQVAPAVVDAVAGYQYLGRDLPEAVEHRLAAHVGRTEAPNSADAGGCKEGHHGLGNIGQISCHPIPRHNTLRAQMQSQRGDLSAQLRPRQHAGRTVGEASLVVADDGVHACGMRGVHMPEDLIHIVRLRVRKPVRAGHAWVCQHCGVRCWRIQAKVVPDALPKRLQVAHRPAPQGIVAVE